MERPRARLHPRKPAEAVRSCRPRVRLRDSAIPRLIPVAAGVHRAAAGLLVRDETATQVVRQDQRSSARQERLSLAFEQSSRGSVSRRSGGSGSEPGGPAPWWPPSETPSRRRPLPSHRFDLCRCRPVAGLGLTVLSTAAIVRPRTRPEAAELARRRQPPAGLASVTALRACGSTFRRSTWPSTGLSIDWGGDDRSATPIRRRSVGPGCP